MKTLNDEICLENVDGVREENTAYWLVQQREMERQSEQQRNDNIFKDIFDGYLVHRGGEEEREKKTSVKLATVREESDAGSNTGDAVDSKRATCSQKSEGTCNNEKDTSTVIDNATTCMKNEAIKENNQQVDALECCSSSKVSSNDVEESSPMSEELRNNTTVTEETSSVTTTSNEGDTTTASSSEESTVQTNKSSNTETTKQQTTWRIINHINEKTSSNEMEEDVSIEKQNVPHFHQEARPKCCVTR